MGTRSRLLWGLFVHDAAGEQRQGHSRNVATLLLKRTLALDQGRAGPTTPLAERRVWPSAAAETALWLFLDICPYESARV